jgi:hypothetical protein
MAPLDVAPLDVVPLDVSPSFDAHIRNLIVSPRAVVNFLLCASGEGDSIAGVSYCAARKIGKSGDADLLY